jgi:hypothetical protein
MNRAHPRWLPKLKPELQVPFSQFAVEEVGRSSSNLRNRRNLRIKCFALFELRLGVISISFQVDKSFENTVRNIPGVGAQRINDAAPANTTIYRVKSKHIVCEEYRDAIQRREVTSDYDCFRNREDEWVCGSGGTVPPRIIQLK